MAIVVSLLAILLFLSPGAAHAHEPEGAPAGRSGVRVHVGMWTSHVTRVRAGLDANWLFAVSWNGLYGGTFINSFGNRAFAAGIERDLARADGGTVARGLGYRLGVVSGYDERLVSFASKVPVLPALQVMGNVALGPAGVELAWAGKVATVGPFMRVRR